MTDPIRPTDAELEAGRARLMGLDHDFTIAPMPTSEETFRAQVLGRTVREQTPPEAPEYINLESVWEHCGHTYNKCEGPGECMCECPDCDMACKVEPK